MAFYCVLTISFIRSRVTIKVWPVRLVRGAGQGSESEGSQWPGPHKPAACAAQPASPHKKNLALVYN